MRTAIVLRPVKFEVNKDKIQTDERVEGKYTPTILDFENVYRDIYGMDRDIWEGIQMLRSFTVGSLPFEVVGYVFKIDDHKVLARLDKINLDYDLAEFNITDEDVASYVLFNSKEKCSEGIKIILEQVVAEINAKRRYNLLNFFNIFNIFKNRK